MSTTLKTSSGTTCRTLSPSPSSTLQLLPTELLLSIAIHLEDGDILSMKRTSHFFRALITNNAPQIANSIIRTHFSTAYLLLKPVLDPKSGYLVPKHPCILEEEVYIANYILDRLPKPLSYENTAFLHERPLLVCRLSRPGPTFLKFLRAKQNLWVEKTMLDGGDVTEAMSSRRLGQYYVRPFLDQENCKGIFVQRGFRSRKNSMLTAADDG